MIKTISLSIILVLLTGMLACQKDKPTPCSNDSECFDFDWGNQSPMITWFSNERYQYKSPYFNPNNGDEFVYNFFDFELKEFILLKYNLSTNTKTKLSSNVKIISQPKWGRKGWIAFDNVYNANYQIWIIKDDGDSLKQFTSNIFNLFPVWNAKGDNLYWQHTPVLGIPYYFLKQNLYNSTIDTIMRDGDKNNGYTGYSDVSIGNKLLTNTYIGNESHLAYSEISSISFTPIFNISQEFSTDFIRCLTWSENSNTAYFTVFNNSETDGLFKLNVLTTEYTRLLPFCNSKRYIQISVSPDGTKLIGERIDSYLAKGTGGNPTGQIIENSSIYIIDLQTLKETKINLE